MTPTSQARAFEVFAMAQEALPILAMKEEEARAALMSESRTLGLAIRERDEARKAIQPENVPIVEVFAAAFRAGQESVRVSARLNDKQYNELWMMFRDAAPHAHHIQSKVNAKFAEWFPARAAEADAAGRVQELEAEVERLKNGAVPELAADDHVGKVIAEMYNYCAFHEEGCFGCIDASHTTAADGTRCATHQKLYDMIVRVDRLTTPRAVAVSPTDEQVLQLLELSRGRLFTSNALDEARALIETWPSAPSEMTLRDITRNEFADLRNLWVANTSPEKSMRFVNERLREIFGAQPTTVTPTDSQLDELIGDVQRTNLSRVDLRKAIREQTKSWAVA